MKPKEKQKYQYRMAFRDVKRVELFSLIAPFWSLKDAQEYAKERLIKERQTFKAVYSVITKRITNKNY